MAPRRPGRPWRRSGLGVLALHVGVALGLHLAGLDEADGGGFELALALAFGGELRGALVPFLRREQVPINGVGAAVQAVERDEIHVAILADAFGAEAARFVRARA